MSNQKENKGKIVRDKQADLQLLFEKARQQYDEYARLNLIVDIGSLSVAEEEEAPHLPSLSRPLNTPSISLSLPDSLKE